MSLFPLQSNRYIARCGLKSGHGSWHTLQWAPYYIPACLNGEMDEYTDEEKIARDSNVLLKFAIGPSNGKRRNVRISSYVNITMADREDKTFIKLPIDENNEMEVTLGEPMAFHMREMRTADGHSDGRTVITPTFAIWVMWSEWDQSEICFSPSFVTPNAYCTFQEIYKEGICDTRIEQLKDASRFLQSDVPSIPERPRDRPAPPPPPATPAKRARTKATAVPASLSA